MAKNQKSILVLRNMTESQVKGFGMNIAIKRRGKYWIGLFIISLLWAGIISNVLKPNTVNALVAITPLIVSFAAFYQTSFKMGKRLWNDIKDKQPPVKVDW